ncbi:peptide/nickel transport system substrate-binding protein [Stella humosa]|uniref:Peptide/nickel transport system substrate-binding protein n=1 Tax=Stella humosa TaxID=94 RepID=A0A3N1KVT9_9PROT|nr:ABC transporter substrate-binding protein [Stella humosa]ROP84711.1 peptide/nickel transport system substrate-binding protein [Stella humosa]BBK34231.1 ABC transporter substrate-binding protein [Stella humosa]
MRVTRLFAAALGVLTMAVLALAAPPPAFAQPKDRLTIGMGLEPPHLDPTAGAAAAIDEVTYANLFEGLVRIDQDGKVQPQLARSWTVSPDGLTYTFELLTGVAFHDGSPFTAADVKFSWDRARGADSVNAQKRYFAAIDRIETPDPARVVVVLTRRDGYFLFNMGSGDAVIVSAKTAEANKATPIGTGPFRFERWGKGDRVVLVRNDAHRNVARTPLKQVTFRFIGDPSAQVASLLAGDVDLWPNIGAAESLGRLRADGRFTVQAGQTEGETVLAINNRKKPFDDVRVRRAISHVIDRKAIIDGAMQGFGTPIGSHFSPANAAYVDLTGTYPHDVARAKALLAEAGFPNGIEATLKLPPPAYARRGGEIVASQLAQAGIRVKIEPVEWAQWLSAVFRGRDFDLSIVSHTEPMDIDVYARDDYYFGYSSDRFKAVMAAIDAAADEGVRARLFGDAQRILAEDAVNAFLFQLPKLGVWNRNLTGVWVNSPIQANDVTGVAWK